MNCRGLNKKLELVLDEPDESIRLIKACAMLNYIAKKGHKHENRVITWFSKMLGKKPFECEVNYVITLIGLIQVPRESEATRLSSDEYVFMQNELSALFS